MIRDEARSLSVSVIPLPARSTVRAASDVTQLKCSASLNFAYMHACLLRAFTLIHMHAYTHSNAASRRRWHPRGGFARPTTPFKRRPNTYRRWHSRDLYRRLFVRSAGDRGSRLGADVRRARDLARRRALIERRLAILARFSRVLGRLLGARR